MRILLILSFVVLWSCNTSEKKQTIEKARDYQAISLLGDTLRPQPPSEKLLGRYAEKKAAFESDSNNLDNIIWLGRFTAYQGKYNEAISIYTTGMTQFPEEPRLYRHRGHRYISIREFDNAIADLELAASLIEGTENKIEPDGMPNARNIPVSTLHGNIYYHLGLAYYLKHDWEAALEAYKKCLDTSSYPDNVVSATHWIYMILQRMGREGETASYLENITADMDIIENMTYHKACLLYKGTIAVTDIDLNSEENPANSALKYAVGNWYLYNDKPEQARAIFNQMVAGPDWASFGFIAAESELASLSDF